MKTIKIKAAEYDLVVSSKREKNEEKSYEKGYEGENICGKMFIEFGNNAEPIRKGVCCNSCNSRYIIPTRLLAPKINAPVSYEITKVGQKFLDLSKELYEKDFEYISKNQNGDIKVFRNLATGESVIVCII